VLIEFSVSDISNTFDTTNGLSARYSWWIMGSHGICPGHLKHWMCQLTLNDLPHVFSDGKGSFFANKFSLDYIGAAEAVGCLHQHLTTIN
jgi:hypothetical protein